MHFYVDESGHTGTNVFDPEQPMLYYGCLSSRLSVDLVAKAKVVGLRKRLGVTRLHASELGNAGLAKIAGDLLDMQRRFDLRFAIYRVAKPDHAVICFFDQVFDSGMNPAITWTGYWTPLRYILLLKLAYLFDEELARLAWQARIEVKDDKAQTMLVEVCDRLLERVNQLPDARSRELVGDTLSWARAHPADISYNVGDRKSILQVSPNIIGFQFVMTGIADKSRATGVKPARIVVDRQSQFNKAQRTLAEFYAAAGEKQLVFQSGPGMPNLNFGGMPQVPIEVSGGEMSVGLELTDIYLWIYKRVMERGELTPEVWPLVRSGARRVTTDELSLDALSRRWKDHFQGVPELHEMPPDQVERGRELLAAEESRRLARIGRGSGASPALPDGD
jgi:hypothetical protein